MDIKDVPTPLVSFSAGAVAGLIVDVTLFPLDTLKTRIQSEKGLWNAGGFKNVYKGIGPTVTGSAPCAAIFFLTYNETKGFLTPLIGPQWSSANYVISASIAEVVVNMVKVPVDIVKQRRQTSGLRPLTIMRNAVQHEGVLGLYRGFGSTIIRDIPFSIIQFPLWEAFKLYVQNVTGRELSPVESAACGAMAGSIAGAVTTPLDLAKTRIMLADHSIAAQTRLWPVMKQIYSLHGIQGLFTGFILRTSFIFIGGGIFFGCYETAKNVIEALFLLTDDDLNR